MNVLLVSMCHKNALTESRRILDQFAQRSGDRSWLTPITQDGLDTLRRMLRKTARRNTAVACHWIRGQNNTELLWIVGDASQFNAQGVVPTNRTERNVLRRGDENDWHSAEDIKLLAAMAALFHDFGKANQFFQKKLKSGKRLADPYRHEWISLRLFQAFIGNDNDVGWLTRLSQGATVKSDSGWYARIQADGDSRTRPPSGLDHMPPLAQTVGWLVLTHHRLPTAPERQTLLTPHLVQVLKQIDADWCGRQATFEQTDLNSCWHFARGLPDASKAWRDRAAALAQRMLGRPSTCTTHWQHNSYVVHLSRLTLILADHHYSSLKHERDRTKGDPDFALFANTVTEDNVCKLNQPLDEHLIGVEKHAQRIARCLPRLADSLPHIARHKGFKRRVSKAEFRWQDQAFDLATSVAARSAAHGFFGVNMASTGCGKTLANGRIMYALADPQKGARFCVALGLRTLTLQTGTAYRQRLTLDEDDLAVLVGNSAVRQLYNLAAPDSPLAKSYGSESSADLMPDNTHVHFDGAVEAGPLNEWLKRDASVQKLLAAPVLVCTIDHLMPACESTRGGHQIAPMLRLLTSDLVLDEPDDFGMEDLPALTRLVHLAAVLGGRVLLSSATLPPALLQGLFAAYLAGRAIFQANRGVPGLPVMVCCGWFDEYGTIGGDHADETSFATAHAQFTSRRIEKLSTKTARRLAQIVPVPITARQPQQVRTAYAELILPLLTQLHQQHATADPHSGKQVSFGLLRMANIDPLIDVVQALFQLQLPADCRLHVCVYHSRHPLLVRGRIERLLDAVLQRHQPRAVFDHPQLRELLDGHAEHNQIFLVAASPVAEVGRDHDYDWAVVEPSSMRSIIQLAGRIRRHREGACLTPNLLLLDCNRRALEYPDEAAFMRPGFETSRHLFNRPRTLGKLLRAEELAHIDARWRIQARDGLSPQTSLVDLEHARLADMMGAIPGREKPARRWWTTPGHLSGHEQGQSPFRHDPQGREPFVLLPDATGESFEFRRFERFGEPSDHTRSRLRTLDLLSNERIQPWGAVPYMQALDELASDLNMDITQCARRFGIIDLPTSDNEQGWRYHPALGFRRFAR